MDSYHTRGEAPQLFPLVLFNLINDSYIPPLFRRYWSYVYQFSHRPVVDGHDHMAPPWRYMGY